MSITITINDLDKCTHLELKRLADFLDCYHDDNLSQQPNANPSMFTAQEIAEGNRPTTYSDTCESNHKHPSYISPADVFKNNSSPVASPVSKIIGYLGEGNPHNIDKKESQGDSDFLDEGRPDNIDAKGNQWDARIHSRNKSLLSDGTFRLLRGVDHELVIQVLNEQANGRILPAANTMSPTPVILPPPPPPPAPPEAQEEPAVQGSLEEFRALMTRIMELMSQNKLPHVEIIQYVKSLGLPNIPALGGRLDLVSKVSDWVERQVGN